MSRGTIRRNRQRKDSDEARVKKKLPVHRRVEHLDSRDKAPTAGKRRNARTSDCWSMGDDYRGKVERGDAFPIFGLRKGGEKERNVQRVD